MLDVARIGIGSTTSSVSSSSAGIRFFNSVKGQSRGGGGAQQGGGPISAMVLPKSPEVKTDVPETSAPQKKDNLSHFYASNNGTYLPRVDYFSQYREQSLHAVFKGKAGFSSSWKQGLFA
jgi:hypothetical protein